MVEGCRRVESGTESVQWREDGDGDGWWVADRRRCGGAGTEEGKGIRIA